MSINNKTKKNIFITLLIISLIFIIVTYKYIVIKYKLPKFRYETNDNIIISTDNLKNSLLKIFIIHRINAITESIISSEIKKTNDKEKIIIFSNDINILNNIKKSDVYIVNNIDINDVIIKFNVKKTLENRMLVYRDGILLKNLIINNKIIRNLYEDSNNINPKGNISKIFESIIEEYANSDNGLYYFTKQFNSTCACLNEYKYLENKLLEIGMKINLVVLGELDNIDISNYKMERGEKANIVIASEKVNNAINNWKTETKQNDINIILLFDKENKLLFPLIDNVDYEEWVRYRNEKMQIVFERYKRKG